MKDGILYTLLFVGAVLLLTSLCLIRWGCNVATGVVDKVVNPSAIIVNYEWYETQFRDIKAAEGQIKDAEDSIKRYKEDNKGNWTFDQREEYARLNSNVTGLRSYRRSLIEAYNAKASMITRNMWKSGTLPQHIDQ